ncbi:MAG: Sec-independent protein translocase subunit TatA/TatB, partial [Phycisphaeraceae bacterium]
MPYLPLTTLGFVFGSPGPLEIILLALLGLLIFGKRLPEVGKSIGRGIVEFKKGLSGVEDDINSAGQPKQIEGNETETHTTAQQQKEPAGSST